MAPAEALFDERREAVRASLGMAPGERRVTGGNGDDYGVTGAFLRLMDMADADALAVSAVVMGETLASGSAAPMRRHR